MKHEGKATRAALKMIYWTLFCLLALALSGVLARILAGLIVALAGALIAVWLLFGLFCFYFFRDPNPDVPTAAGAIAAPAHGKVDVIEQIDEPDFLQGRCQRISIFLSVLDVHVQYAPVAGTVMVCQHKRGQFLNAMRTDSAAFNENVLIGFGSSERPNEKIGVRLIAGLIARRIVPWATVGDVVARGERISLIQFGSRCDLYLPLAAQVRVKLGDHVRGGETVVAEIPAA
jgi:phosphatidylserine decarboxylase